MTIAVRLKSKFKPDTLDAKVSRGELMDIHAAALQTGYSEAHIRRLCNKKKVGYSRRGGQKYFFTPANLSQLFQHVAAKHPCRSRSERA